MTKRNSEIEAVRAIMTATGLTPERALEDYLRRQGRDIDRARKGYLRRTIPARIVALAKRAQEKSQHVPHEAGHHPDTPLPDDSEQPLSYDVNDDGRLVVVNVDRYLFTYAVVLGKAVFRDFHSTIEGECAYEVQSDIRSNARVEAQNYVDHLPPLRKELLSRKH